MSLAYRIPSGDLQALQPRAQEASRLVRAGALVLGLGLVPALGWLAWAPLAAAVVAPAVVKVDLNRRPVQHAEGGTVAEVRVRDGQHVRQGEPLLVLGDVPVAADLSRLDFRVLAEQAGIARLEAEQALAAEPVWPPALVQAARGDARVAEQLAKERALFKARHDALREQLGLLRAQREKVGQEIAAMGEQVAQSQRALAHQRAELEMNRSLVKDGFVSATRIAQLEAAAADYAAKLEEKRSELARAEQRRVDGELRMRTLENERRQQASDQLKVAVQRLSEIEQERRKTRDAAQRQVIAAPADGEVMGLKVTTPGTVIAPRETIADIVPDAPELVVEARVRPEDIDRVRREQPADIRFTAFDSRTTPLVQGSVGYVSADRLVDPATSQPFYLVHVRVEAASLQRAGTPRLHAGMPAEVFLKGRQRTPLQYLLEPISDVLRLSARER